MDITELQYTPGKGYYKSLKLSSNKTVPIIIENQSNKDIIEINQTISKETESKHFRITAEGLTYNFKIRTLRSEQLKMKIYFFFLALFVILGGVFKLRFRKKKRHS